MYMSAIDATTVQVKFFHFTSRASYSSTFSLELPLAELIPFKNSQRGHASNMYFLQIGSAVLDVLNSWPSLHNTLNTELQRNNRVDGDCLIRLVAVPRAMEWRPFPSIYSCLSLFRRTTNIIIELLLHGVNRHSWDVC